MKTRLAILLFPVLFYSFFTHGTPHTSAVYENKVIDLEKLFNQDSLKTPHPNDTIFTLPTDSAFSTKPDTIEFETNSSSMNIVITDTIPVNPADTFVIIWDDTPTKHYVAKDDSIVYRMMKRAYETIVLDSADYELNPLFYDLVYMGVPIDINREEPDILTLYHGRKARTLYSPVDEVIIEHPAKTMIETRKGARKYITENDFSLYVTTFNQLPKLDWNTYEIIEAPIEPLVFADPPKVVRQENRIIVRKKKTSFWYPKMNSTIQFSQNAVSKNWHKGGNNFNSILGTISGNFNYNNKKKVEWKNSLEWRTGFNTVTEDTLGRKAMPSEDLLRIISDFSLNAIGNFSYNAKFDVETQLFRNPKAVNSYELKARLFTPVKANLGIGMKYSYKRFSVNALPLNYRLVHLTDTSTTKLGEYIPQGLEGVEKGQKTKKTLGGEITVTLKDYKPLPEIKLNSNLKFFTDYNEIIIVDWEVIAEFSINRYLSTRLIVNPRYDSSVKPSDGSKPKIQIKEMLTFGFSYRLI